MKIFTFIYKYFGTSLARNLKATIIIIGIVPLFIVSLIAYNMISRYQWDAIYGDALSKMAKAADAINIELSTAVQSSEHIVSNPYIISGLSQNYEDNIEKKVAFNQMLDMYFANYKDPLNFDVQQPVIFNDNDTIFNSKYTQNFSNMQGEIIKNKVLSQSYSKILWDTESESRIIFYRKFENTGSYNSILKVSVPHYKIDYIIKNLSISTESMSRKNQILFTINPSSSISDTPTYYSASNDLISGSTLNVLLPVTLKTQVYLSNFIIIFSSLLGFVLVMIIIANVLSTAMTKKIYDFIANIEDSDLVNEHKSINAYELTEFVPIGLKIKELIGRINDVHGELEHVTSDKVALELEFMQSKINPHLLYNSLSSMKWNAMSINNDAFARNIDALALYYRDVLSSGRNVVKIRQEIDLVKKYIKVMEFAHSHEYKYEIDIDKYVLEAMTVKHILQPIVENSILHGINRQKDGLLKIVGYKQDSKIILKVIDNGCGMSEDKLEEINSFSYISQYKNYGIKNTIRRIKLYYGDECYMNIESQLGVGTTTTIAIENTNHDELLERFDFLK